MRFNHLSVDYNFFSFQLLSIRHAFETVSSFCASANSGKKGANFSTVTLRFPSTSSLNNVNNKY